PSAHQVQKRPTVSRGPFCHPRRDNGLVAFEGSAEDVAERSARVRRAVLLHSFLLFSDFASFDRETQLTRLRVDRHNAHVDLVASVETLRALLSTVTRQVRTTDERLHAFVFDF